MRSCIKNIDTRVILFRNLLKHDYKIDNINLDNLELYHVIVAYNCFDDNIVGIIKILKDSKKIEYIYLDEKYKTIFSNLKKELINISREWYG